ncbi:MAG: hypothetical protein ABI611_10995 [Solirubrobacteraceae bacterium]
MTSPLTDELADQGIHVAHTAIAGRIVAVEHPRVGDLAGERDPHAGPQRRATARPEIRPRTDDHDRYGRETGGMAPL